jgi:SAM-dependent methyltransferase
VKLPLAFDEIVDEIVRFTDLKRAEVEHRVWMHAIDPGWNVRQDVFRFGVTPHQFDERMLELYREGDGFIFDSLVFWAQAGRPHWATRSRERIEHYARASNRERGGIRILIHGDGVGNESLFLAHSGYRIDYFDVPGSRTFDFAVKRFAYHGFLDNAIRPVVEYDQCLNQQYDVVISFEVLEHLPDPVQAIHDISAMLKVGGIALITEDFDDVVEHLPTHLKANARLAGRTPFLFLKDGMLLTWYSRKPLFKPYEFTKVNDPSLRYALTLLGDGYVRGPFLARYLRPLSRKIEKLAYLRLRNER